MAISVMTQLQEQMAKLRNEAGLEHDKGNIRKYDHIAGKADGVELAVKILVSNLTPEQVQQLWKAN
jgi:hypothetical protein